LAPPPSSPSSPRIAHDFEPRTEEDADMNDKVQPQPALPGRAPCPNRIEVEAGTQSVTAVEVRTWLAHLRSHGWTDSELDLVWITRARYGVTR
jgi:hypothetical protein